MEVLINIGIFALGVIIGGAVMACMATAGYADTLQDTYDRGFEDGQKSMRGTDNGGTQERVIQ